jgi:hypothetical protein
MSGTRLPQPDLGRRWPSSPGLWRANGAVVTRRRDQRHILENRRRFGLPPTAVLPLFGEWGPGPVLGRHAGAGLGVEVMPRALVLYEPGLTRPRRFLARLGTSSTVTLGIGARPVPMKALVSVGVGAVAGTVLAQPFDAVTFVAPLYGLVVGGVGAGLGWTALRGRGSTTIEVERWRPQLEAIGTVLRNADRIGQPFASPQALRSALHSALWHAVNAVGEPGERDVLDAFDEQLGALLTVTGEALVELESPSIEARKASVTERLAAAVEDMRISAPSVDEHAGSELG